MNRNRKTAGYAVAILAILFCVAAARQQKKTCPTCPDCPGGVCPVKYGDVLKAFGSADPDVDIPMEWREKNYSGGSCVHATTETLLRWVGQNAMADWWRETYRGGESPGPHSAKLESAGLKFVMTTDGDIRLIDWALKTRRGCGVGWPTKHCTALVGHKDGQAIIEDNNHPGRYTKVPWDDWVSEWRRQGGWAFAFTYSPPPPVPKS